MGYSWILEYYQFSWYFYIQIFDIWSIFKTRAMGDVECTGNYLWDQKITSTNSRAFQMISEKFPGKSERILCVAEMWHLGCVGRGNPVEIIPSHLVRWRVGDDRQSTPRTELKCWFFSIFNSRESKKKWRSATDASSEEESVMTDGQPWPVRMDDVHFSRNPIFYWFFLSPILNDESFYTNVWTTFQCWQISA